MHVWVTWVSEWTNQRVNEWRCGWENERNETKSNVMIRSELTLHETKWIELKVTNTWNQTTWDELKFNRMTDTMWYAEEANWRGVPGNSTVWNDTHERNECACSITWHDWCGTVQPSDKRTVNLEPSTSNRQPRTSARAWPRHAAPATIAKFEAKKEHRETGLLNEPPLCSTTL